MRSKVHLIICDDDGHEERLTQKFIVDVKDHDNMVTYELSLVSFYVLAVPHPWANIVWLCQ
jgi:hypothetical protein